MPAQSSASFFRNVLSVASGTALAQAITLSFTPFLTRLYGPQAYGLLGVFTSTVALTAAVAALSYPLAIVLPREPSEARGLARLSLVIGVVTALIAAALLAALGPALLALLALLNAQQIGGLALLIPVAMLAGVCAQVMQQWLVRHEAFAFGARYAVLASLLTNSAKAAVGWVQPTAAALVVSGLLGSLAGTVLTWLRWRARAGGHRQGCSSEAPGKSKHAPPWRQLAWQHRDFALLRAPLDSLNAFSHSAPLLLLAAWFGASAAGQYTLAAVVLGAPVVMLGNSVGSVFYPRVTATLRDGGDAAAEIRRATAALAALAALPFLLLMMTAPEIFSLVFGQAWQPAGEYARWLAPWLFLQIVNKPAVAAIPGLGLQRGLLLYELASTSSKLLALWVGYRFAGSDTVAVALFSLAGCLTYLWLIAWVISRARRHRTHHP